MNKGADEAGECPATIDITFQSSCAMSVALGRIGRVVAPALTDALYAPMAAREPYADLALQRDVQYGPYARNLLDIFRPRQGGGRRPVLVFVHGGAFMRGDRQFEDSPFNDNIAVWAVRHGMVGVNMTYRLAPANGWPAAQHDLRCAITWLRENIAGYGGDPRRIVIMGHSAGAAHVAQYVAFPEFHAVPGSGLAGAILFSGIYDPATAEVNPPLQAYFGTDPSCYPARSAIPGLLACRVPQLMAYAERDPPDFCQQSEQLKLAMYKAGKSQALYRLAGHNHMSEIFSINSPDTASSELIQEFVARLP